MEHIEKIVEQIEELNIDDFNTLRKKYFNIIKTRQKQKFNEKFPNLELDEYKLINCVIDTIYYYKFSSQEHTYELEIIITNTKTIKYKLNFFVDYETVHMTTKIPEKKIIINKKINIKEYLDFYGNEVDITLDDLENIVNYLFFNKKFIYNI